MMDLERIRIRIDTGLSGSLPGQEAHRAMVPQDADLARLRLSPRPDARESSVLILIYPGHEGLEIIMIRRPEYSGVHSGQIAFPGGRREDADRNHLETALRETMEEISLDLSACDDARIHGSLSMLYIPPSNFKVYPFVATCSDLPPLQADTSEVSEILSFPLSAFTGRDAIRLERIRTSYGVIDTPCYKVNGHIIWGASAMMLSELAWICREDSLIRD